MTAPRPDPPPAVRWITSKLEKHGFETWTVGGAVRDALLGRRSGDWDLATRATPAEMRALFKRTIPIGVEHGTVGILRDGTLFETTTFRRDIETDGRHAVVRFADTIEEDLARRDFTVNAIAWHALREELRDPFDGAGDLARGILRTVGSAEERFREDYLRILRAFRFAGRFGLEVDADVVRAARALSDHLGSLSAERIRDELTKVLDSDPNPTAALEAYRTSGASRVLYPEWVARYEEGDGPVWWAARLASVAHLPCGRPLLRLAALLRGVPPEAAAALLVRLRFSNRAADRVARIAAADPLPGVGEPESAVRRWLSAHGPGLVAPSVRIELAEARAAEDGAAAHEAATDGAAAVVARWRRVKEVVRSGPPLVVGDLAIDGRRLRGLGLRPGPLFGEILDDLLDWVLEEPSRNTPDQLEPRALAMVESRGAR